jgi:hypothetical protein
MTFSIEQDHAEEMKILLKIVYDALKEKGYNPVNQIVGYLLSEDPTYIVPLSEMFGYATDLRSKTQGRGQYFMEPSHYAEVPKSVAEKIISDRAKRND